MSSCAEKRCLSARGAPTAVYLCIAQCASCALCTLQSAPAAATYKLRAVLSKVLTCATCKLCNVLTWAPCKLCSLQCATCKVLLVFTCAPCKVHTVLSFVLLWSTTLHVYTLSKQCAHSVLNCVLSCSQMCSPSRSIVLLYSLCRNSWASDSQVHLGDFEKVGWGPWLLGLSPLHLLYSNLFASCTVSSSDISMIVPIDK